MKRLLTCLSFLTLGTALLAQSTLTLEDAVDAALKNNFDIRIARTSSQVAEANNTAGNAGMLPTAALVSSFGLYDMNNRTDAAGVVSNSTNNYLSGNAYVQLNWTLFDGGKMFLTRRKLNELSQLGSLRLGETVQQKMYEVVSAYYELVRLKQQLRAVQQTIRYNEERVVIAQTGFNAGSLSKPDLLQAKTDLNEVKVSAITQAFALREGQRALNALLARDTESPIDVLDSIPSTYHPDKEALLRKLNADNKSLLAFQKQLEINRLALKEVKTNYLPTLDLNAQYLLSGSKQLNTVGSSSNHGPSVGGSLVVPLYQAGENNRKKKVAELSVEAAQTDLANVRSELNRTLQNALNDFDNQQALLKLEEENNAMTKEYLEISMERLRLGQTNSLEVHLAQEKYLNSNTRLINYRFNLKMAETKLRQLVAAL